MTDENKLRAEEFLAVRSMAYKQVFCGARTREQDVVLQDLAKFCRAQESTFHPDGRVHAVMEGRREVWLRIAQHLYLPDDQLWAFYGGSKSRGQS